MANPNISRATRIDRGHCDVPWTRSWQNQGIVLDELPNVKRWHDAIAARPAVQRGVEVLASMRKALQDDKAREVLFGATQYAKH